MRTSYDGLKREVLQAFVLIALVILLFLQSVRGTLIVSPHAAGLVSPGRRWHLQRALLRLAEESPDD